MEKELSDYLRKGCLVWAFPKILKQNRLFKSRKNRENTVELLFRYDTIIRGKSHLKIVILTLNHHFGAMYFSMNHCQIQYCGSWRMCVQCQKGISPHLYFTAINQRLSNSKNIYFCFSFEASFNFTGYHLIFLIESTPNF